jgi:uncharacterized protein (DUF433 family)
LALAESSPYPRIIRDPRIHGGEPVVRGTRVPVRAIVVAWSAEPDVTAMLDAYPRLTDADVREALAYYRAHRDEMDGRIRAQFVCVMSRRTTGA